MTAISTLPGHPDVGSGLAPVAEIIEDARNGRMFILIDDDSEANTRDLVISAQFATPAAIEFMTKLARGPICLALPDARCRALELVPMKPDQEGWQPEALVWIDAHDGITTGLSAPDRACTIRAAINPTAASRDIVTPGHVRPLTARDGGVLIRAGRAEAAMDISRLAGLTPASVTSAIMDDRGAPASLAEVMAFARMHGLRVGTVGDLVTHRCVHDTIIETVLEQEFLSEYGGAWRIRVYLNKIEGTEHLVLIKGELNTTVPVMVRMHALNVMEDLFGLANGRAHQLNAAMAEIARHGSGAVVMPREADGMRMSHYLKPPAPDDAAASDQVVRAYGMGCLMLLDLGIRQLILLTNSGNRMFAGLRGFGIRVNEERAIPPLPLVQTHGTH